MARQNGAVDLPDKRDYHAEQILGKIGSDYPDSINLAKQVDMKPQDQENSYACTAFGVTNVHQILNKLEHGVQLYFDAWEQWKNQLEKGTAQRKVGDSLQDAVKQLKDNGLTYDGKNYPIEGYARIGVEEIKNYIAKGYPVYTGSGAFSNWSSAKKTGELTFDGSGSYGHAWCIVGYEDDYFIGMNSWGADWGFYGDGTFRVHKNNVGYLFTPYIIYDKQDLKYIFKDVTENSPMAEAIQWVKDEGIMKGYPDGSFLPDRPVTRAEMAQILFNNKK